MAAARHPQAQAPSQPLAAPGRPRGGLVAFEGIDGSGKSTLARVLHARLVEQGRPAVLTREPTDTWLGQAVHQSIRGHGDPFVDAFLFLADHATHVREVRAWVAEGKVVVTDRWGDSCLAYQAAALEPRLAPLGRPALEWLLAAQQPVTLRPDVVVLLDLPAEEALRRIAARPELVKYERADFLGQVRRNYLDLAKRFDGYEILDATQPPERLAGLAWQALQRRDLAPS